MMVFAVIVSTTICIFADCVCELFDKWMFGGECMRGEMDLREEYLIYSLWYTQTNNRLTMYWKQALYREVQNICLQNHADGPTVGGVCMPLFPSINLLLSISSSGLASSASSWRSMPIFQRSIFSLENLVSDFKVYRRGGVSESEAMGAIIGLESLGVVEDEFGPRLCAVLDCLFSISEMKYLVIDMRRLRWQGTEGRVIRSL